MSGSYAQQDAATANMLGMATPGAGSAPMGMQQVSTGGFLGPTTPSAPSVFAAQDATTANLLGTAPPASTAYGTTMPTSANWLGPPATPSAGGAFAAQQATTAGLLQSTTPLAAAAPLAGTAPQATAASLVGSGLVGAAPYGVGSVLAASAMAGPAMAAPITPLAAATEPGPGMASFVAQQEATAMLMNPAGTTAPGVGGAFAAQQGGAFAPQQGGAFAAQQGGAFAAQQEATAQLLGTGATNPAFQAQQEVTARLMGQGSGTRTEAAQDAITQRLLGGEGLRARNTGALSMHTKRAAARAEANTRFALVLNGEIQSAQLGSSARGPLMCVFSMQHGADWTVVSGAPNGITQLATSSLPPVASASSALFRGGDPREVVWNFPIGLVFKSTSPFGWPRIVVTVYGTDLCNRRVIKGYGSVHIPCQPGRHMRTVRLYCPMSSSPLTRFFGALFGNPAQLVDPKIVAGTEGREVIRVQSGGKVRLHFDVLLKDTESFNYSF